MLSILTYYPEKTSVYLVALVQQYYTRCRKRTTLTAAILTLKSSLYVLKSHKGILAKGGFDIAE